MTTYNWSALTNGQVIAFNPARDVLHFGDDTIVAGVGPAEGIYFDFFDDSFFYWDGKEIELSVAHGTLHSGNVTFASGSKFLIGDNTAGTANDNGPNTLTGGAADDYLSGDGGADRMVGNDGNDAFALHLYSLSDTYGNDTILGGLGLDYLFYDGPLFAVKVNLATGIGTGGDGATGSTLRISGIEQVTTGNFNDTITGDGSDNRFHGQGGNDWLIGGGGNDRLGGDTGADTLDGGAGLDAADYSYLSTGPVKVNLSLAGAQATGGAGSDKLISIENLIGSSYGDTLLGNGLGNRLTGSFGNDTLTGGAGDDTLDGGVGTDRMVGGAGNDTYFVDSQLDKVIEAAGEGNDTVRMSVPIPLPAHVENIIFTGVGSISIAGNETNNIIGGGAFDDTLSGGGGNDTVSYALASAAVTVNLETDIATGHGTDVLSGFENATGGSSTDVLIGDSGANVLDGGSGADTMSGGYGNDTYYVDSQADVVEEESNSVPTALLLPGAEGGPFEPGLAGIEGITDTVIAAINFSVANLQYVENITLNGAASQATGNALANVLRGNDGNDTLHGGGGNDTLSGGAGMDRLLGGTGNDMLIWGSGDVRLDGGSSTDTLKTATSLDLTALANSRFVNLEQISMVGGGSNVLTLNVTDVLDFSTSTDTLKVLGDVGDTVHRGSGWLGGSAIVNGYRTYTQGAATLLVDSEITSVV